MAAAPQRGLRKQIRKWGQQSRRPLKSIPLANTSVWVSVPGDLRLLVTERTQKTSDDGLVKDLHCADEMMMMNLFRVTKT